MKQNFWKRFLAMVMAIAIVMSTGVLDSARWLLASDGEGTTQESTENVAPPSDQQGGTSTEELEVGGESGTETGTEDGTETGTEDGTEDGTETGTEDGTEDGTEAGTEDGTEDGTEAGTEDGTEAGTEDGTETGTEDGTETGTEDGTETGTENGTETGTEGETAVQDVVLSLVYWVVYADGSQETTTLTTETLTFTEGVESLSVEKDFAAVEGYTLSVSGMTFNQETGKWGATFARPAESDEQNITLTYSPIVTEPETPAEGEETPADGTETPADGEETPADGEETPADGE